MKSTEIIQRGHTQAKTTWQGPRLMEKKEKWKEDKGK